MIICRKPNLQTLLKTVLLGMLKKQQIDRSETGVKIFQDKWVRFLRVNPGKIVGTTANKLPPKMQFDLNN